MTNSKPSTSLTTLQQTVVIIPARNEEQSIGLVLNDLPNVGAVIVVNNGSTDRTAAIADDSGCIVIEEPIAGYGRACLAGMNHLQSLVANGFLEARYVAFIDADYSDHAQELTEMSRVLSDEEYDFVLGSRMIGDREKGAMPPQALFGNWLACTLMRLFWNARFTDLGPFRLIRYEQLMTLDMQDLNYGWTIEMQIKAVLAGLRIKELPARYRRRIGVSKISGTLTGTIKAGYKILFTIARMAWQVKLRRRSASTSTLMRSSAGKVA